MQALYAIVVTSLRSYHANLYFKQLLNKQEDTCLIDMFLPAMRAHRLTPRLVRRTGTRCA